MYSSLTQAVNSKWERTKDGDEHMGWAFPASETEEPGAEPDPLYGARSIRQLYELASANYTGKYSVPVRIAHIYSSFSFSLVLDYV